MNRIYPGILLLLISLLACQGPQQEGKMGQEESNEPPKILFVCSSVSEVNGKANGTFLSELAIPFILLQEKGYELDILSPKGGPIPIYYKFDTTELIQKALDSDLYKEKTAHSLAPAQAAKNSYDALIIPGGYGQFWDLQTDTAIHHIIQKHHEEGGVIGTLGHGTSSLLPVSLQGGTPLVKGKTLTCFPSWFEREVMTEADHGRLLPFDMEIELEKKGAHLFRLDKERKNSGQLVDTTHRLVTAATATSGVFIADQVHLLLSHEE